MKTRNKKSLSLLADNAIKRTVKREQKRENLLIKGIVENLSRLLPYVSEKEIMRNILLESRRKGEIVDFLEDGKSYRDFVVIVIREARYAFFNLKIGSSTGYKEKRERLRKRFESRFLESKVTAVIAVKEKMKEEVEEEWKRILSEFKNPN